MIIRNDTIYMRSNHLAVSYLPDSRIMRRPRVEFWLEASSLRFQTDNPGTPLVSSPAPMCCLLSQQKILSWKD